MYYMLRSGPMKGMSVEINLNDSKNCETTSKTATLANKSRHARITYRIRSALMKIKLIHVKL